MTALASHQCGSGLIPAPGVLRWLSLLLVLVLAPRGFSVDTPVFPSPQKPTYPNYNSFWNLRATGLSVLTLLSVTLVKQSSFIHSCKRAVFSEFFHKGLPPKGTPSLKHHVKFASLYQVNTVCSQCHTSHKKNLKELMHKMRQAFLQLYFAL